MIEHKFRTANIINFHSFVDARFEILSKYVFVNIPIEANKLVKSHGDDEKEIQGKRVEGRRHERGEGKTLRKPKVPNTTLSSYMHSRTHVIV